MSKHTKVSIVEMFTGQVGSPISAAQFIAENHVSYRLVKYGYLFDTLLITDDRFKTEEILVHNRSLHNYWMVAGDLKRQREVAA